MRPLRRILRILHLYTPPLRLRQYDAPPTPPPAPKGYVEYIPDRGEMFYRDSGPETAQQGTVLLLHGWLVDADINWAVTYAPLIAEGYRVIAPDHRGHGRGMRTTHPFKLQDVADDAAALVRFLRAGPVTAVGYSMGGAIAQIIARDHPELVDGIVLAATALQWKNPRWVRVSWKLMALLQFLLRVFPRRVYEYGMRDLTLDEPGLSHWLMAELHRGDPEDIAAAGRQLSEFDSRPWVGKLDAPVAVICTTQDHLVPPYSQREIARYARDAVMFEVPADHLTAMSTPPLFANALLKALANIRERVSPVAAAVGNVVDLRRQPDAVSLPEKTGT